MIRIFVYLVLILGFSGSCCRLESADDHAALSPPEPIIRFAVAGHTYGNPDTYTNSIYPPFWNKLQRDHLEKPYDFLFLTGDVVAKPTKENWSRVAVQLDSLDIPWFVAPGNHDLKDSVLIPRAFGQQPGGGKSYLQVVDSCQNLFLVLNTSNAGWTLDSNDMRALKTELADKLTDKTKNIFVFTHQLWWLKNTPLDYHLDDVRPNSQACFQGDTDFWATAYPLLKETGKELWFFAGDMGSHYSLKSYYEDRHGLSTFIGSGMGGGVADNYVSVNIYKDGSVEIRNIYF